MKTQSHKDAENFSGIQYGDPDTLRQCAEVIAEASKDEATPRPWRLLGPDGSNIIAPTGQVIIVADKAERHWKANAALIVRAVNSHAALVEALKSMLPYAKKLLQVSGSIDGIVGDRDDTLWDIEKAQAAIDEVQS